MSLTQIPTLLFLLCLSCLAPSYTTSAMVPNVRASNLKQRKRVQYRLENVRPAASLNMIYSLFKPHLDNQPFSSNQLLSKDSQQQALEMKQFRVNQNQYNILNSYNFKHLDSFSKDLSDFKRNFDNEARSFFNENFDTKSRSFFKRNFDKDARSIFQRNFGNEPKFISKKISNGVLGNVGSYENPPMQNEAPKAYRFALKSNRLGTPIQDNILSIDFLKLLKSRLKNFESRFYRRAELNTFNLKKDGPIQALPRNENVKSRMSKVESILNPYNYMAFKMYKRLFLKKLLSSVASERDNLIKHYVREINLNPKIRLPPMKKYKDGAFLEKFIVEMFNVLQPRIPLKSAVKKDSYKINRERNIKAYFPEHKSNIYKRIFKAYKILGGKVASQFFKILRYLLFQRKQNNKYFPRFKDSNQNGHFSLRLNETQIKIRQNQERYKKFILNTRPTKNIKSAKSLLSPCFLKLLKKNLIHGSELEKFVMKMEQNSKLDEKLLDNQLYEDPVILEKILHLKKLQLKVLKSLNAVQFKRQNMGGKFKAEKRVHYKSYSTQENFPTRKNNNNVNIFNIDKSKNGVKRREYPLSKELKFLNHKQLIDLLATTKYPLQSEITPMSNEVSLISYPKKLKEKTLSDKTLEESQNMPNVQISEVSESEISKDIDKSKNKTFKNKEDTSNSKQFENPTIAKFSYLNQSIKTIKSVCLSFLKQLGAIWHKLSSKVLHTYHRMSRTDKTPVSTKTLDRWNQFKTKLSHFHQQLKKYLAVFSFSEDTVIKRTKRASLPPFLDAILAPSTVNSEDRLWTVPDIYNLNESNKFRNLLNVKVNSTQINAKESLVKRKLNKNRVEASAKNHQLIGSTPSLHEILVAKRSISHSTNNNEFQPPVSNKTRSENTLLGFQNSAIDKQQYASDPDKGKIVNTLIRSVSNVDNIVENVSKSSSSVQLQAEMANSKRETKHQGSDNNKRDPNEQSQSHENQANTATSQTQISPFTDNRNVQNAVEFIRSRLNTATDTAPLLSRSKQREAFKDDGKITSFERDENGRWIKKVIDNRFDNDNIKKNFNPDNDFKFDANLLKDGVGNGPPRSKEGESNVKEVSQNERKALKTYPKITSFEKGEGGGWVEKEIDHDWTHHESKDEAKEGIDEQSLKDEEEYWQDFKPGVKVGTVNRHATRNPSPRQFDPNVWKERPGMRVGESTSGSPKITFSVATLPMFLTFQLIVFVFIAIF